MHLTKTVHGNVEAGPNAVLALAREGYKWQIINFKELYESLSYIGLQKFILKFPLVTSSEILRSLLKPIFVKSLQRIIPDIRGNMLSSGNAGIRAQLINTQGDLEQDFDIRIKDNVVLILNAPRPAATSSLSISEYVVDVITQ